MPYLIKICQNLNIVGLGFFKIKVKIRKGKVVILQYVTMGAINRVTGMRSVFWRLNGEPRTIEIRDNDLKGKFAFICF